MVHQRRDEMDIEEMYFDELNSLNRRSIPYDEYFDEMDIEEEEKEKRKSFAEKLDDVMLFIFALFGTMKVYKTMNRAYIEKRLYEEYTSIVNQYMIVDDYLQEQGYQFSQEIIDATIRNEDDAYFLSVDRAILISENAANGVFGYQEFKNAIQRGKTMKEWVDIRDKKERKTHRKVGGKKIPILEPFVVGDSLMLFPKDQITYSADAKEIVNCRCSVKYF